MNRIIPSVIASVAALITATPAFGHGPQIQLTADGTQIVTRKILIDTYHPLAAEKSIYVLPVAELSGIWVVKPPGASSSGPGIAPGVGFVDAASHPFKSGLNYTMSFADGLKKWDGADFVDAGDAQLQLFKTVSGTPLTATTTDAGPFAGLTFSLNVTSQQSHTDMGYRFLGDGVSETSSLDDGVYLLTLTLTHQAPGSPALHSDPFYYILPKSVSSAVAGEATFAFAQQEGFANNAIQAMTQIHEPQSALLAALGIAGSLTFRKIRRFEV